MNTSADPSKGRLLRRMNQIISDPEHPLMAAAVGVMKNGEIIFSDMVGKKQLDGDSATANTKFRIASISKLLTAVGVWQLIEQILMLMHRSIWALNFAIPIIPIYRSLFVCSCRIPRLFAREAAYQVPTTFPMAITFANSSPKGSRIITQTAGHRRNTRPEIILLTAI